METIEILKKYCKKKYGNEIVIKTYDIQEIKQIIDFTKQLLVHSVIGRSNHFSEPEKMAEWLHNNYEEIALNNGWKTQEDCQVPFLELPKENKETMIELCDRFINGS